MNAFFLASIEKEKYFLDLFCFRWVTKERRRPAIKPGVFRFDMHSAEMLLQIPGVCRCAALATLVDRRVVAQFLTSVELARTADALGRIFHHFLPLGDPADGTGQSEQNGKHRGREAKRA